MEVRILVEMNNKTLLKSRTIIFQDYKNWPFREEGEAPIYWGMSKPSWIAGYLP